MFSIKNIRWMIIAIVFALTGLVITQIYWIKDAIQLKNEEFDKNISSALYNSIDEYHKSKKEPIKIRPRLHAKKNPQHGCEIIVRDSFVVNEADTLFLRVVECCNKGGNNDNMFRQRQIVTQNCNLDSLRDSLIKQNERVASLSVNDQAGEVEWATDPSEVYDLNQNDLKLPLEKRVDIKRLDSLFKKELSKFGINQEYIMNQS